MRISSSTSLGKSISKNTEFISVTTYTVVGRKTSTTCAFRIKISLLAAVLRFRLVNSKRTQKSALSVRRFSDRKVNTILTWDTAASAGAPNAANTSRTVSYWIIL